MKHPNAPSAASFHHRRNTRVTVTPAGKVIETAPVVAPEVRSQVKWEASVVDATSNEPIAGYPVLQGEDTITVGEGHGDSDVVSLYLLKLRFIDGEKPDVVTLSQKLNLGIWEVAVTIHSTKPL